MSIRTRLRQLEEKILANQSEAETDAVTIWLPVKESGDPPPGRYGSVLIYDPALETLMGEAPQADRLADDAEGRKLGARSSERRDERSLNRRIGAGPSGRLKNN
jgi:hypothetical protein